MSRFLPPRAVFALARDANGRACMRACAVGVATVVLLTGCGSSSEAEPSTDADRVIADDDAVTQEAVPAQESVTSSSTTQVRATFSTSTTETTMTQAEATTTQAPALAPEADVERLERELVETRQRLADLEEQQARQEVDQAAVERAVREVERERAEEARRREAQRVADEGQRAADCANVEYWNWPFPKAVWPTGRASQRLGPSTSMSQSVVIANPIAQPASTASWDGRWTDAWNHYWARHGYSFGEPPLPWASEVEHDVVSEEIQFHWPSAQLVVPEDEWFCWQLYEQQPRTTCRWVSAGDGMLVQRCD